MARGIHGFKMFYLCMSHKLLAEYIVVNGLRIIRFMNHNRGKIWILEFGLKNLSKYKLLNSLHNMNGIGNKGKSLQ